MALNRNEKNHVLNLNKIKFEKEDKECSFQPKVNKISYLMDLSKNT